jgi:hypothetical protein
MNSVPNNDAHFEHSLWLLPAEPLREKLRSIIRRLADTCDAVDFEPHVTISCGPSHDDEIRLIAREIASRFPPVELAALKLDHARDYTKTLFVQFRESAAARSMFDVVRDRSALPLNHVLNPHLSLLYKTMPETAQAELCRSLDAPKGIYLFDRLRVIETEIPLTQPEQIKNWRTVFEGALRTAMIVAAL